MADGIHLKRPGSAAGGGIPSLAGLPAPRLPQSELAIRLEMGLDEFYDRAGFVGAGVLPASSPEVIF